MAALQTAFDERVQEIEAYLDLLDIVERQVQSGPPRLVVGERRITVDQQRILYSGVYLQLYSLVSNL